MNGIRLLLRRGEERLLQLRLDRSDVSVGSDLSNDVVVPGTPEVAARIHDRGAGRYHLIDLSDGALTVDGQPVAAGFCRLSSGDAFELSGYVLELHTEPSRPSRGRRTDALEREPAPGGEAWLTHRSRSHRLARGDVFDIGNDEDNDLVLSEGTVSGFHCRVAHDGAAWHIEDLGSTNGTLVNGVRVARAELPDGARIEVGRAELRFSSRGPDDGIAPRMVAASEAMLKVLDDVRRFADAPEAVLVVGSSGTGKEGISRALHDASRRSGGPYVPLNCGALASSLIESELFGHVKGAFTGATTDKKGAFEEAHGGTLFLDEIGELPLDLQPKLLRVLETKSVRRLGAARETPVDTRVVAATHRNLQELVAEGLFRADLFHRLFVLVIAIPDLSERPADIEPLAERILTEAPTGPRRLTSAARDALLGYDWPGNVRELKNVLLRAVLSTDGPTLDEGDLVFMRDAFPGSGAGRRPLSESEARTEIVEALRATNGNRAAAARRLGMSKSTFYDKVRRLGIDPMRP